MKKVYAFERLLQIKNTLTVASLNASRGEFRKSYPADCLRKDNSKSYYFWRHNWRSILSNTHRGGDQPPQNPGLLAPSCRDLLKPEQNGQSKIALVQNLQRNLPQEQQYDFVEPPLPPYLGPILSRECDFMAPSQHASPPTTEKTFDTMAVRTIKMSYFWKHALPSQRKLLVKYYSKKGLLSSIKKSSPLMCFPRVTLTWPQIRFC